jgi:hypothetical protein
MCQMCDSRVTDFLTEEGRPAASKHRDTNVEPSY